MTYEKEIELLESEWSPGGGFFWQIRHGNFSSGDFERVLRTVAAISVDEDAMLPRRVVSLLWYIPVFMQWQLERVKERGQDVQEYTKAMRMMTNQVERLLGVP